MNPYYEKDGITLYNADCIAAMRALPSDSVDSIVTDPPYGLSFMGRKWDVEVPPVEVWQECLRVLKPGGHLLSFAGTRTQHRMAVNIEDAGFEIRDMLCWVYGSGFPKSLDVSKAIDKAAGAEREVVGEGVRFGAGSMRNRSRVELGYRPTELNPDGGTPDITAPATEAAKQWEGWGTALKPALEPITMARKPLEGTVAANVLEHGTGAINVDGCRVGTESTLVKRPPGSLGRMNDDGWQPKPGTNGSEQGRYPANLIHDGSDEVVRLFPQTGAAKRADRGTGKGDTGRYGVYGGEPGVRGHDDNGGSAARFFYCAKASKDERRGSKHPTVKPLDLMRYLVRMVTPVGATVLDPFAGSGTTIEAAMREHCRCIGIERGQEYCDDAVKRLTQRGLF